MSVCLSVCCSSFSLQGWYYHLLCTLKPPSNSTVHYLGSPLLWGNSSYAGLPRMGNVLVFYLWMSRTAPPGPGSQAHTPVADKTGLSLKFRLAPVQRADSDDKRGGYHGSLCRWRSQHGLGGCPRRQRTTGFPGVPVTQREDLIRQQM